MQRIDGHHQYRATSLSFVTYGLRGIDLDNITL
jgi:hypothetical protein